MNEPLHEHIQVGARAVPPAGESPARPVHEPLLARIEALQRSVQRWRLISLVLFLLLLSGTAIGGTFGAIVLFSERGAIRMREAELHHMEMLAREQEARAQAEAARHQAELERDRVEQLRRKDPANQQ